MAIQEDIYHLIFSVGSLCMNSYTNIALCIGVHFIHVVQWICLVMVVFIQDPGERSDRRSRQHQSGGSDTTFCCYSPQEHKGNSSVSANLTLCETCTSVSLTHTCRENDV